MWHRTGRATTVVQVWHAVAALKRFGADTARGAGRAGADRSCITTTTSSSCTAERSREPWAAAFRTPVERVLPLGTPRTDFFADPAALAAARARVLAAYPALAGRRVVLYAPTFRGRGAGKRAAAGARCRAVAGGLRRPTTARAQGPSEPRSGPRTDVTGFDVVIDPARRSTTC